jgi:hypothetical protein
MIASDQALGTKRLRLLRSTWQNLALKIDPGRSRATRRTRALYWLNGTTQSILHRIQNRSYADALATVVSPAPVFVLGFWRSGTTLLDELLCCDPRFGFPSTYACLNPAHFLLSERWPRLETYLDRASGHVRNRFRFTTSNNARECLRFSSPYTSVMDAGLAGGTKGDQVLFDILAGVAAKLFVMDFQVRHCPTGLTSPAVATQHLLTQSLVRLWIESQARRVRIPRTHGTFSLKPSRNASR